MVAASKFDSAISAPHSRAPVPTLLDTLAQVHPDKTFASIAASEDASTFTDVSFRQFSDAVNRIATTLIETLGLTTSFNPIAYIGRPDLRYYMLFVAAQKAGYIAYFPSPRNPHDIQCTLLERAGCHVFAISDGPVPDAVETILRDHPGTRTVRLPELHDLLSPITPVPTVSYGKTFDQARYEPCALLHSSGSTGIPKLVTLRHGVYTNMDTFSAHPRLGLGSTWHQEFRDNRVFVSMPPFHAAGLFMGLVPVLYLGMTLVLPPSTVPLSLDVVNAVHQHANVAGTLLASSMLADIVADPPSFKLLERVGFVGFAGAPLPPSAGQTLCTKIRAYSQYGSTELGVFPMHNTSPSEWQYLAFNTDHIGCKFHPLSGGLYELVMVRDPSLDPDQGVFNNFPDLNEWATNDLYERHPTRPELWRYYGRKDDIVVLSNGEKFNPSQMEEIIASDPGVSAAIVAGHGHFQSSLLVEPAKEYQIKTEQDQELFVNAIWASVEKANQASVRPARITRGLVLVLSSGTRFPRTAKGSIQRDTALKRLKDSLESLYADFRSLSSNGVGMNSTSDFSSLETARESLKTIIAQELDLPVVESNNAIFSLGLDSISVLNIVRKVNGALRVARLAPRDVYRASNIEELAEQLAMSNDAQMKAPIRWDRTNEMELVYQRLSADLIETLYTQRPSSKAWPVSGSLSKETFLLTGSNGNLGTYVLDCLVQNEKVEKIYCLNRSADSKRHQESSCRKLGMASPINSKVTFLHCNISEHGFGLPDSIYAELAESVTVIIHNAWTVNFNLPLSAYEQQLQAVSRLIQFQSQALHPCALYFFSTISAAMGNAPEWTESPLQIREEVLEDWTGAETMGYAQSKLIAERLIDRAATLLQANSTICRIGQIAGPIHNMKGQWSPQEWIPSLVRSSEALGMLPETLGSLDAVDWVPVDELAPGLMELIFAQLRPRDPHLDSTHDTDNNKQRHRAVVHHAVNPTRTTWSTLAPTVLARLPQGTKMVPLSTWVNELSSSPINDLSRNPAAILVDFFKRLVDENRAEVLFDTTQAQSASAVLRNVGAIKQDWMDKWMLQWGF